MVQHLQLFVSKGFIANGICESPVSRDFTDKWGVEGEVSFVVYSLSLQPPQELCAQLLQNGQEKNQEFATLEGKGDHLSVLWVYSTI